jgi:hypothetical protein
MTIETLFRSSKSNENSNNTKTCILPFKKIKNEDKYFYKLLKNVIYSSDSSLGHQLQFGSLRKSSLAKNLFIRALKEIETNSFKAMPFIIKLLRQSSCLGNNEASFMLSTIYSDGIGVKSDKSLVNVLLFVNLITSHIFFNFNLPSISHHSI